jgi:tetratricopeptide (TPR) repeat protein
MYYDSSLAIYRTLGDKKGEAAVLNYIGIVYQDKGEFSKAIDRTLQGLVIRKTTNDHLGIVFSYLNVGNIFLAGGQTEQAIKYYQDGLDYAIRHGVNPPAMTFNSLGNAYLQVGDFKKAGEYLLKGGKEHVNKSPDELLIARLFYKLGEPDSALLYFKKVYENPGTNIHTDRQAQALAGLSRIMMEKGDNKQAIELAKKSYEIPGSVNKLTIAESAGILGELYEQNGEQAKALTFYKVQHGILDSIANRNYQNKLAYFETNSEMEKVNSQLQALSVQKALQEKLYRQEKLLKNFLIAISIQILICLPGNISG